jgi:hypothetical protein
LSTLSRTILLALPLALGTAACSTVSGVTSGFKSVFSSSSEVGPDKVDDLLSRIERVYVECELSQQSSRSALEALESLVSADFSGDPVAAYTKFLQAAESSRDQADALKASVGPMKEAAGPFFDKWATDLAQFSSMDMRLHSQNRLTATRDRYEAILAAVEPAMASYRAYNATLSDHVLFLSHDFNASAVAAIEGEVRALTETAAELDILLGDAREAAQQYVRAAALRGQIDGPASVDDESVEEER